MTNTQHSKYLDEFVDLLEQEKFYEAHEAIEIIWFKRRFEDCDEIRLLKGFINASVCFELIKRGRVEQSKRVWKTYLKYKPLLHKIDSPHINNYHQISRYIEDIYIKFNLI